MDLNLDIFKVWTHWDCDNGNRVFIEGILHLTINKNLLPTNNSCRWDLWNYVSLNSMDWGQFVKCTPTQYHPPTHLLPLCVGLINYDPDFNGLHWSARMVKGNNWLGLKWKHPKLHVITFIEQLNKYFSNATIMYYSVLFRVLLRFFMYF